VRTRRTLSPAMSTFRKSPGEGSTSSRPAQNHSAAKMRSRSISNDSGDRYAEEGRVRCIFVPSWFPGAIVLRIM